MSNSCGQAIAISYPKTHQATINPLPGSPEASAQFASFQGKKGGMN